MEGVSGKKFIKTIERVEKTTLFPFIIDNVNDEDSFCAASMHLDNIEICRADAGRGKRRDDKSAPTELVQIA